MAKPTRATAAALNDLDRLERLHKLDADDKLREIRVLESKLRLSREEAKGFRQKYHQASKDMLVTETNIEQILANQDNVTVKKLERSRKRKGRGKATAIICVNDWHIEERVDPSTIEGVANEFNPRIADRRINKTWEKALYLIDFARNISNITEVILWAGGDLINGYIHEEMEESNYSGPGEAQQQVIGHLASGLDLLKREAKVESLVFLGNYGNHGRTTRKPRAGTGWQNSWEWAAYTSLAGYYNNNGKSDVQFKIAKGAQLLFPVQGHTVRFQHGDDVKYCGGTAGMHGPLRRRIAALNKPPSTPAELDILGHFHQFADDWNYVVCGCLVGPNAYARSKGFEVQPPTQTMVVVDYEHGKVMALPIFCDD